MPSRPHDGPQQHDLLPAVAASFVATAGVGARDVVLEVGSGTGELTAALLARSAQVHAVEIDPERLARLRTRFAAETAKGQLTLHHLDARRREPPLPDRWRVVANPPFALTAVLVRRWLFHSDPPPSALDLVLQYQAALKLSGRPGEETRSSALMRLVGPARVVKRLNRDDVVPPSRVDLCGWSLRRRAAAPPVSELAAVDRLLERAFAGPHTVLDALRGVATPVQIRRQGRERGWDPSAHPRTLKPEDWLALAQILVRTGKL